METFHHNLISNTFLRGYPEVCNFVKGEVHFLNIAVHLTSGF